MKLSSETIRNMMNSVKSTRDQELTCGHCYDELDLFIEMKGQEAFIELDRISFGSV